MPSGEIGIGKPGMESIHRRMVRLFTQKSFATSSAVISSGKLFIFITSWKRRRRLKIWRKQPPLKWKNRPIEKPSHIFYRPMSYVCKYVLFRRIWRFCDWQEAIQAYSNEAKRCERLASSKCEFPPFSLSMASVSDLAQMRSAAMATQVAFHRLMRRALLDNLKSCCWDYSGETVQRGKRRIINFYSAFLQVLDSSSERQRCTSTFILHFCKFMVLFNFPHWGFLILYKPARKDCGWLQTIEKNLVKSHQI